VTKLWAEATTTKLHYRPRNLLIAVVDIIYENPEPTPWLPLIEYFVTTREIKFKTVENTLHDLMAFGAIQRIGHYGGPQDDTRAVRATDLGRAWMAGEVLPTPHETVVNS
jgi:hypothetical protein